MKQASCLTPIGILNLSVPAGNTSQDCNASLSSDFAVRDTWPEFNPACNSTSVNTWGPQAYVSQWPAPATPPNCNATQWMQNRIVQTIDHYVTTKGYNYCHHHTGKWAPLSGLNWTFFFDICPAGDPTSATGYGCSVAQPNNSFGIDCTHYTSWAYLYGLGNYLVTATGPQGCGASAPGRTTPYTKNQQDSFNPGDIIYLNSGTITTLVHGILWTGIRVDFVNQTSKFGNTTLFHNIPPCQQASYLNWLETYYTPNLTTTNTTANSTFQTDHVYVISDSHWNGPNYRPFGGWYYNAFSHARRLINPDPSFPLNPAGVC